MLIEVAKCAHAIFNGLAPKDWVETVSAEARKWFGLGVASAKGFINQIGNLLNKVKDAAKGLFSFMRGWFRDDPVGAGAAVGLAFVGGAILLGGAVSLGIIGGGAAALIKGALIGTKILAVGGFLVTGLFMGARLIAQGFVSTYNFDWNVSIKGIREKQKQLLLNIIANSGEATGTALGGLICGINKDMANVLVDVKFVASLWRAYDEDIKDEILDGFGEIVAMAKSAARQIAALELFHNVRSFVKAKVRTGIPAIDRAIAGWGAEGSKPFVFAEKVESYVESIKDETLKNFAEEAVEGFLDICRESLWKPV